MPPAAAKSNCQSFCNCIVNSQYNVHVQSSLYTSAMNKTSILVCQLIGNFYMIIKPHKLYISNEIHGQ